MRDLQRSDLRVVVVQLHRLLKSDALRRIDFSRPHLPTLCSQSLVLECIDLEIHDVESIKVRTVLPSIRVLVDCNVFDGSFWKGSG